ncbi:14-3-3 protein D [Fasciola hepatica]|uniref:14-3-3 protein D n=1 Tax=Fasciola hepatica TaxID=6192 RepID=A0A4E0R1S3_FASHE|nr:14-3-3 protein D [Fasciola hepatica]
MERKKKSDFAKIAEESERYDEMVKVMNEVAKLPDEMFIEKDNLLSVEYENVIEARSSSWHMLNSIERKDGNENLAKQ